MLHYKKVAPSIQNVAEKENVMKMLQSECSGYGKGDSITTRKIAERLDKAIINGDWVLEHIDGLPTLEDTDVRNRWLYQSSLTFTIVQDAMKFLESL